MDGLDSEEASYVATNKAITKLEIKWCRFKNVIVQLMYMHQCNTNAGHRRGDI